VWSFALKSAGPACVFLDIDDSVLGLYQSATFQGIQDQSMNYLSSVKRKTQVLMQPVSQYEGNFASIVIEETTKVPNSLAALAIHCRSVPALMRLGPMIRQGWNQTG